VKPTLAPSSSDSTVDPNGTLHEGMSTTVTISSSTGGAAGSRRRTMQAKLNTLFARSTL